MNWAGASRRPLCRPAEGSRLAADRAKLALRRGEIDLIAEERVGPLVFAEVRMRQSWQLRRAAKA